MVDTRSAPSSIVSSGFCSISVFMCEKNVSVLSPFIANVGIPKSLTSDAATSSCVESGLDAARKTLAPPALSVRTRFAVSAVTCRTAASVLPLNGCSFSKRARTERRTGMSRSAHSMRFFPSPARLISFMSLSILKRLTHYLIYSIFVPDRTSFTSSLQFAEYPMLPVRMCIRTPLSFLRTVHLYAGKLSVTDYCRSAKVRLLEHCIRRQRQKLIMAHFAVSVEPIDKRKLEFRFGTPVSEHFNVAANLDNIEFETGCTQHLSDSLCFFSRNEHVDVLVVARQSSIQSIKAIPTRYGVTNSRALQAGHESHQKVEALDLFGRRAIFHITTTATERIVVGTNMHLARAFEHV